LTGAALFRYRSSSHPADLSSRESHIHVISITDREYTERRYSPSKPMKRLLQIVVALAVACLIVPPIIAAGLSLTAQDSLQLKATSVKAAEPPGQQ
jgi:hypothetical protein